MMHNKARLVFLSGFMLILWSPMVLMVTGLPHLPKLDENRKLTSAPVLQSWHTINQYTRDSVKWFDDNFGFRDFLIRAKTQIDYSVFNISDKVHIGSDGWLFYRSVMDVEKPNIEIILRKDADAIIEGTQQLANTLAARNIKLIIMIAPMKDVFYSEHLPNTAKKLPNPHQVDYLQDRLRSMKEIIFLDSTAILREVASKRNVFHKTDFHWNDPAAFEVARVLVNEIGKIEGKTNPVWGHNVEIEEKTYSGGEATFLPIFYPPIEKGLFVKPNWIQPPYKYAEKKLPFEWIYEIKTPTEQELQPIAVIGDSFFDGMLRSGVCIYFKKVYKAHWHSTSLKELVSNLPADVRYLFIEFIEVNRKAYLELTKERTIK
jgi:hypothetical protein